VLRLELFEIIKANCMYVTKKELSEIIYEDLNRKGLNIFKGDFNMIDIEGLIKFNCDKTIMKSSVNILKLLDQEGLNLENDDWFIDDSEWLSLSI
jgi:hypothetical protein